MHLLHQQATASTLARFRIFVFALWFVKIVLDPFPGLADVPSALFNPPGVLLLIPAAVCEWMLTREVLWTIKVVLSFTLAGAAAGWRYRPCAIAATALLVLQQGLMRGFTYIYHEEMPLLYAASILAILPCDDALAIRRRTHSGAPAQIYGAGLFCVGAMLCMVICFTGVYRCVIGGVDVFTSDSIRVWSLRNSALSAFPWADAGPALVATATGYAAMKAGFVAATLIEVCAPLALLSRRFRRAFAVFMFAFFAVTALVMNVLFWETALLLVVFFDAPPSTPVRAAGRRSGSTVAAAYS